ncbi:hypothetical protein SAMN05421659_12220 [[Clostridium] fimetarium]|uniref:Uncharacterized protein n=1 Tax=[Clostridium] fimetarium TaxID=99656 RepID=A0A1I0RSE4_9FIRM|nr:hypothetical protein SAMN05421659_12220 [[Clostridium] fimetarium]
MISYDLLESGNSESGKSPEEHKKRRDIIKLKQWGN